MEGCLSENAVQEMVAGTLTGDRLAQAQQHIETCSVCRALVIELARDSDLEATGEAVTHPAKAAPEPALRGLADRFEILRAVGRGGMGVVYEALDRQRGVRVALKTLRNASADGLLRFKTEFRALQDVQHPNVVRFGELIEDGGQWWLTMELVEGTAFVDHVRPRGRLDERRLRAALAQLAAALHALHAHQLIHRDVKPHNVLVTPAGRVVLLDFGLVTRVAQSESNVVGTAAYMAPEQGLLQEIGPAADWYGVGALLYEALTGALPFEGHPLQILMAKQRQPPRRPCELASVPGDLEALCLELLSLEPAARLNAAAALTQLDPSVAEPPAAPTAAFVGRQRELSILGEAFAATRAGSEAIVLVQGDSGIGKSALVGELIRGLRQREPSVLVLTGRCYERETVPYKGIDGVVDELARYLRKLPEADAAAVLPRRAGLLAQAFPVLGKVPALRNLPVDGVVDPVELRTRAFAALRELLGRLSERCPLVVWIEDLHWAASDSLELLAWVMAPPEAPPLLLLLTSRPPGGAADHPGAQAAMARVRQLPRLHLLELSRLPRSEAVMLAQRLLAGNPAAPPASAEVMADEAAGHPLFIDALVRHVAGPSAAQAPVRLSEALWARFAELDPVARRLLSLIAVAGWPLPLELLAAAAQLPESEIDPAIARLRQAHLARAGSTGKGAVEPYHDFVREAVLEHLDPDQRRACHRALARALLAVAAVHGASFEVGVPAAVDPSKPPSSSDASWGPELVGVHLQAAGDLEQAVRYLMLAADQAVSTLAFDRAVRLYRQALALHEELGTSPGPLGDTRDARARLARALVNAGREAEAAGVYFELAGMAKAAGEQDVQLRVRGAASLMSSGRQDEGRRALEKVLDELGVRLPATRAGALWRLLWRRAWVRTRGLRTLVRDRRDERDKVPARELLRLEALQIAFIISDPPLEYWTRYQVLALKTGDPLHVSLALYVEFYLAIVVAGVKSRRVARILEVLASVAERSGEPRILAREMVLRGAFELCLGRWARCREHAARAIQLFRERCLGSAFELGRAESLYFMCLFEMGELRDFVREQLPLWRKAEERGDRYALGDDFLLESMVPLIQDQPEAARQHIEQGLAAWSTTEDDPRLLYGQIGHARTALYEGDGAAAYRWIDQRWRRKMSLPLTRMSHLRGATFYVHGLAALAACRSGGTDHRLIRAAARDARGLRAISLPWTDALARILDAGAALSVGARALAREQFERAHSELSAAGLRAHAELARRRTGELQGGAEGARAIAGADAWLASQGVRAPERLARLYMPEVA